MDNENEIGNRRRFTLNEAREMLPSVREMTADAVKHAEAVADAIEEVDEDDPERTILGAELKLIVDGWADRIREMGLEAKGLWLVDFDNGSGYYCWQYPEESLQYFHGYEDGFQGRVKLQ